MIASENLPPLSSGHRPTRAVVDCAAFASNLDFVRRKVGKAPAIMAVVKADGYGHGMMAMARTALRWGAQCIGVATVDEALCLRESDGFADVPIMLVGPSFPGDAEALQRARISVAVGNMALLESHLGMAEKLGAPPRIHLKFDTGMGRYGFHFEDASPLELIARTPSHLEGMMTHLSVSDESAADSVAYTNLQLDRFEALCDRARRAGLSFITHAANSGAVLHHPRAHYDLVRPGVMLYGSNPEPADGPVEGLRQVMTLATRIVSIHDHAEGDCISYGRTYRMARPGRVGILPLGYGDGFPRSLGNKAQVIVRGRRVSIVGRVCMDQTMIDITDIPEARVGDAVVLYGYDGSERIPLEEVARHAGTITYEITCQLGKRVPRVVVEDAHRAV